MHVYGVVWYMLLGCAHMCSLMFSLSLLFSHAHYFSHVLSCTPNTHVHSPPPGPPLAVRHGLVVTANRVCIVGGGAFCFSFGSVFGTTAWIPLEALQAHAVRAADTSVVSTAPHTAGQQQHGQQQHGQQPAQKGGKPVSKKKTKGDGQHGDGQRRIGNPDSVLSDEHPVFIVVRTKAGIAQQALKALNWIEQCYRYVSLCGDVVYSVVACSVVVYELLPPHTYPLLIHSPSSYTHSFLTHTPSLFLRSTTAALDTHPAIALPLTPDAYTALSQLPPPSHPDTPTTSLVAPLQDLLTSHDALLSHMSLQHKHQPVSPAQRLHDAVSALVKQYTGTCMPEDLRGEIPMKWERLGDVVLIPANAFCSGERWGGLVPAGALWRAVAGALGVARLARQVWGVGGWL